MEIDVIGDGEYFTTEIDQPKFPTDYERCKIVIKPTEKLLGLLKFLEELKYEEDKKNEFYQYNLLKEIAKLYKHNLDKKTLTP